jgi:hypothetical protein
MDFNARTSLAYYYLLGPMLARLLIILSVMAFLIIACLHVVELLLVELYITFFMTFGDWVAFCCVIKKISIWYMQLADQCASHATNHKVQWLMPPAIIVGNRLDFCWPRCSASSFLNVYVDLFHLTCQPDPLSCPSHEIWQKRRRNHLWWSSLKNHENNAFSVYCTSEKSDLLSRMQQQSIFSDDWSTKIQVGRIKLVNDATENEMLLCHCTTHFIQFGICHLVHRHVLSRRGG